MVIYLVVRKRKKLLPSHTVCLPKHMEYHSCQWANMCQMSMMPSTNNCFPESTKIFKAYNIHSSNIFLNCILSNTAVIAFSKLTH